MTTVLTMPKMDAVAGRPMLAPLLRPEFPTDDLRCLPFVCDLKRGAKPMPSGHRRNLWAVESSGDARTDAEMGMAYAAAYLRYVQLNSPTKDTSALLGWIVRDMQAEGCDRSKQIFIVFFTSFSRYLQSFTRFMPGQEIRNDLIRHVEFYDGVWEKYESMIAQCDTVI